MNTLIIVNPVAGKGKALKIVPLLEEVCKKNNLDYSIKYTSKPKDGTYLAGQGVKDGFQKIVSVGGDGTLNEVVNGIAGSDCILGVIPGGTGNDFARTIYKNHDVNNIIYNVIKGEISIIDIAKCNENYFINIGSGGFDSQVALEAEKTKKFFSGSAAYIVALIKTIFLYKSKLMKVSIDGQEFEKNTLLTAVANGKYYGGGILPAPSALLNDGIFDVCFVENMSKIKMLLMFPKYIKGKHQGTKGVSFYKGRNIKISSEKEFGVNIDGEVSVHKNVEFRIIPNGIRIAGAENI